MVTEQQPTTKPVATQKRGKTTYKLYANGELWTAGKHGFRCGYVMNPGNLDYAINNHEEEMRCLMAEARAEFGC
jgi:hypothetical protein|tara:strand:+ start:199 stop:420 length:222 start_codon:yes stop_codon:yes gene_type:complete